MEDRIQAMYNDCWKIYKMYLADHDMRKYNIRKDELVDKYNGRQDICDLLLWWAGRINGLHEAYRKQ